MPTYLCHGFRWQRQNIRVFIIIHDLLDATPDWLLGRGTIELVVDELAHLYDFIPAEDPPTPTEFSTQQPHDALARAEGSAVKLLEEWNSDETAVSARPCGYVADHAVRIDLSVDIAEEMARYEKKKEGESWLGKLRDQLEAEAQIQWYIIVCDDEDRDYGEDDEEIEESSVEIPMPDSGKHFDVPSPVKTQHDVPTKPVQDSVPVIISPPEIPVEAENLDSMVRPGERTLKTRKSISNSLRNMFKKKGA